jgi:hypothetical protein
LQQCGIGGTCEEGSSKWYSKVHCFLLPPFQIIGRLTFSKYIGKTMYLEKPKRPIIWNEGSKKDVFFVWRNWL